MRHTAHGCRPALIWLDTPASVTVAHIGTGTQTKWCFLKSSYRLFITSARVVSRINTLYGSISLSLPDYKMTSQTMKAIVSTVVIPR